MDRIDHIQVFVRVAQTKSFSKAAELLGLSRASVTTAVQLLEHRLGVRLLHRTTRSVQLTADGENMLTRMIHLLHDFDELNTRHVQTTADLRGSVRMEAPTRMARLLLIPHVPDFLAQHPHLHIDIRSTERMVNLVEEGVDIAVRVGNFVDKDLLVKSVGHLPLINCASPAYLQRHGTPQSTDNLAQHWVVQLASQSSGKIYPWECMRDGSLHTWHPPAKVTVNNAETYIASAIAGMGLIQVPAYDVRAELASGQLVKILPNENAPTMSVSVVSPHVGGWSLKLDTVANWVKQLIDLL